MSNFKMNIKDHLENVVAERFAGSKPMNWEETDDGLFVDFDLPEPIEPRSFNELVLKMKDLPVSGFYELSNFSGAYLDGDAKNKMLQRIYVTAFESEAEFRAHREFLKNVSERDHKIIGPQLKLYSTSEDVGAGLILWNPKGAMVRYLLEQFAQGAHLLNGYQWVYTPHIGKAKLWETSGHLDFYRDSMYNPMSIDGEEYYLKPMNCPFHIAIYNNAVRSYRDLPVKLAEYGTVYRYELSGTLQGLSRVRGFTQDDAHIICTPEQVESEVIGALKFSLYILRSFGLADFKAYISTKPEKKFIGSDDDWETATEVLKKAVVHAGLEYGIDEGGGAFYGPKIDLKLKDALNRDQQCSTIQFDFNLPRRFGMVYIGKDGERHTPVMIHRALFGSLERFMALLIEHYKGDFPLWFAPVQFGIVPIGPAHNDYCQKLEVRLKKLGLRVAADYEDAHMREKIKRFELEKIPLILIAGDKDVAAGGFTVRSRKGGNLGMMDLKQLNELIRDDLEMGKPHYILDD